MKKNFYSLTLCLFILMSLSSCFSVKIVAPANSDVKLAGPYEPLPIKHKVTNWYALFGSVPVTKNSKTDGIIAEMQLSKVRMETKTTFGNYIINILLNVFLPTTIVTNTTIIEGDVKKD